MNLTDESSFRLVFALFWLLNTLVRIYFQSKAQKARLSFASHERQARLGFRLLAIAYLLLIVYPLSPWFDFGHVDVTPLVRWTIGGPAMFLYLALFAWTHRVLGKNWSGVLEIHQDHLLITTGPYRFVRHPMYTAFFLSAVGFAFLSSNWLIAVVYTAAVSYMYLTRVSAEEEMMVARFGDTYKEYMNRTGRLVPLFRPQR